jgi:uncharacterized protein (DUF2141 family)
MQLLVFLLSFLIGSDVPLTHSQLTVQCSFDKLYTGKVYLAVYNQEINWQKKEKAFQLHVFDVKSQPLSTFTLNALPPGTYAISAFLDENQNQEIDRNLIGVPTEAYGFSNGIRPKTRPATWSEAMFTVAKGEHTINIPIKKWSL